MRGQRERRCNNCSTGLCPNGICSQDPRLVARLDVDRGAQAIVDYVLAFDSEMRKLMAPIGNSSLPVGRSDALVATDHARGGKARHSLRMLTLSARRRHFPGISPRNLIIERQRNVSHRYSVQHERMSTQDPAAGHRRGVARGETEFDIHASVSTTSAAPSGTPKAAPCASM